MDIRHILQMVNLILALASMPPAIYLIRVLIRERNIVSPVQKTLNKSLVFLFYGVSFSAVVNAAVAIFAVLGNGSLAHEISPYRSTFVNAFFTITTWLIYYVHLGIKEEEGKLKK